jgi:hypothetical protein
MRIIQAKPTVSRTKLLVEKDNESSAHGLLPRFVAVSLLVLRLCG